MNIAKVVLKKANGWKKLEEIIQDQDSDFAFNEGTVYDIQLLEGNVYLCEAEEEPNKEGFLFKDLKELFQYQKGSADLYVRTSFYKAKLNIGDRN